MKILNLYAGIGGNRRYWGDKHKITAVENHKTIAKIYQDFWTNDEVIVADAHTFLKENFRDYDFIWSSPPCPSHSRVRFAFQGKDNPIFPDLKLYEEIIFLKHYFKGKYCVENVKSYYDPLIKPQVIGRHFYWCNFRIPYIKVNPGVHDKGIKALSKRKQLDISKYRDIDKREVLRNCVEPEVGEHILKWAFYKKESLTDLLNKEGNL